MREGIKMTTGYQLWYMLLAQVTASAISFLLGSVAFWWFLDKAVWKELLSVIFIIINFSMIYSYAHRFSVQDNKPYTPMHNSFAKGVMMGLVISIANIILFILYLIVWKIWGTDSGLSTWTAAGYNTFFSLWTFPYFGIMGMSRGHITWYSVLIFAAMPPAASFLGYYAGYKKFSLLEAFHKFSYEKTDN